MSSMSFSISDFHLAFDSLNVFTSSAIFSISSVSAMRSSCCCLSCSALIVSMNVSMFEDVIKSPKYTRSTNAFHFFSKATACLAFSCAFNSERKNLRITSNRRSTSSGSSSEAYFCSSWLRFLASSLGLPFGKRVFPWLCRYGCQISRTFSIHAFFLSSRTHFLTYRKR